jgi:phosphatidylglycerophosphate synthase
MLEILMESIRAVWFVPLALGVGFLAALHSRFNRPGRAATILLGVSIGMIAFGLVLRQFLIQMIWGTCREGGGRLAVEAQILGTLIFGVVLAVAVGMYAGVLWRRGWKPGALAFLLLTGAVTTVAVYIAYVASGMSAASCFI